MWRLVSGMEYATAPRAPFMIMEMKRTAPTAFLFTVTCGVVSWAGIAGKAQCSVN